VDSYKVLDEKGSKKVKVQLHYMKPIYYDEYKDMTTNEIAAMVRDRIGEVIQANL
jgi:1-acyl-sn-glycerol-3-phosphate acyltransferase